MKQSCSRQFYVLNRKETGSLQLVGFSFIQQITLKFNVYSMQSQPQNEIKILWFNVVKVVF